MTTDSDSAAARPRIVIRRRTGWRLVDFGEIWRYRELLFFLTWRDIKVRYKQTVLGVAWALLRPFMDMVVLSLVFGVWLKVDSGDKDIPYPIFLFAARLPWNFFSDSLNKSAISVVASGHVLKKVYFPRLIIPVASIGAGLIDFAIAGLIMIGLMLYYGIAPTASVLMIIPLVVLTVFVALGVGTFLSVMTTAYRDLRQVSGFMVRIWMFLTPVLYPLSEVKPEHRWIMMLNPMTGIVEAYRSAFLGKPFNWQSLGISCVISLVIFIAGLMFFRRMERQFADII